MRLESGPPWFYAHRDGKKYGVFPLGNVIAMVPSYLTYKLAVARSRSSPTSRSSRSPRTSRRR